MSELKAVELRAELRQIKTMVDHSTNIVFNVPEDCKEQVKALFDWLGAEIGLVVAIIETPPAVEYGGRLK